MKRWNTFSGKVRDVFETGYTVRYGGMLACLLDTWWQDRLKSNQSRVNEGKAERGRIMLLKRMCTRAEQDEFMSWTKKNRHGT